MEETYEIPAEPEISVRSLDETLPLPQAGLGRATAVTLETLSEKLNHIEEMLLKLEQRIPEPSQGKAADLSLEVQGLLQFLKTNPTASNHQVTQLTSKVEKIYQIISSLSGSEGKPQ